MPGANKHKLLMYPSQFITKIHLHALQHLLLELPLNLLSGLIDAALSVEGEEGTEIELRSLEKLDFADVNLDRELANDFFRRILRHKFGEE